MKSLEEQILNHQSRDYFSPSVLILLPLASVAFRVVKRLIDLTPPKYKSNVEEHERFYRELGTGVSEDKEDEDAAEISESKRSSKPSDFETLFGGNNNDHFMIGIKFTRRSIRLYSDFYSSDMIVASPLGLITIIGEADLYKDKNVDYLSSIETYEQFDANTAEDADVFTKKIKFVIPGVPQDKRFHSGWYNAIY